MKKLHFYLLAVFFVAMISTVCFAQNTITILHVNDTHSMLAPMAPRTANLKGTIGGIARAATIIKETKRTDPDALILHGGDVFIGDLFFNKYFGTAELKLMKALGFDAMAVGNHEFDLTPSTLLSTLSNSFKFGGFPLLSANLNLDEVKDLKKYVKPYTIKRIGEIKVGIFGLTTPAANLLSQPAPAVIEENIPEIMYNTVNTLLSKGCDVIICMSHLGIQNDKDLAANVPGINVIISSHDHLMTSSPVEITNPVGQTTYIVQANADYSHIGKIKLHVKHNKVDLVNYKLISLDKNVKEDFLTSVLVKELTAGIEDTYGPVYSSQIGTASDFFTEIAAGLTSDGPHDTHIGNLVTDAFRNKTGTQIAIEAGGSTALPIQKGPIVPADAFRTIGYGFNETDGLGYRLVTFNMTGTALFAGLEFGLQAIEADDELLPQVSGMRYIYNAKNPPLQRVAGVEINGQPLDPDAVYSVTANEFLLTLLTSPMVGLTVSDVTPVGVTEFQVLSEYIASKQIISPKAEGRIVCDNSLGSLGKQAINNSEVKIPSEFKLEQNYPNPFNPATKINFVIKEKGFYTLKVYNMLGEEVSTLTSEELGPGSYKADFDGSALSSGIYIYQLKGANVNIARKMTLIK